MAKKDMINASDNKVVVAIHKMYRITIKGTAGLIMNKCDEMDQNSVDGLNQAKVSKAELERKNWRKKLYTENGMVIIPGENIHECMKEASKYWGQKIPNAGNKTYTDLITSAVICENIETGISENDNKMVIQFGKNVNGTPTHGKGGPKVYRIRPLLPIGWTGSFIMHVFDSRITNHVLNTIFEFGGTFKGLCDWRPTYGRFSVVSMEEM